MNNKKLVTLIIFFISYSLQLWAKEYSIVSPNGKIMVTVNDELEIAIKHVNKDVFSIKAFMNAYEYGQKEIGKSLFGVDSLFKDLSEDTLDKVHSETVKSPFYRQRQIHINWRELKLRLDNGFGLEVRAFDEGVAYRFFTSNKKKLLIDTETAKLCFPQDGRAWLSYSTNEQKPFAMAFQNLYDETKLSEAKDKYVFLPATVECGDVKVTVLESDLRAYPGMFLKKNIEDSSLSLVAEFAKYPRKMAYHPWRGMSYVEDTEDYIAKTNGARTFPWRVFAITERDEMMPVNNLVYALAAPNKIEDISWLHPGKAAWEWWNDWNLKGVGFEAGINTPTYKYYIDFAARNHIPYVVLDEGWYDSSKGDIMNPIEDIDLQLLINYAQEKGVGVVLWTVFNVLDEHLLEACEKYSKMGIKGWKVDFMDRNDQTAVEMAERIADTCAKYRLFLDYHGYFSPTGMNRTYPNILNYEGVFGMEEVRWAKKNTDMPKYDVTFPFIRMMAGSVDFTPGAMRNGTKENWVECYQNPVSMGTRCHQLACYVIHDSPFTMLCDAPTNYEREQVCTDIITSIPDTFDETIVLQGRIGRYIITARRHGDDWYIGGQTNWDKRKVTLCFDCLPSDAIYDATIVTDGINANHNAEDFVVTHKTITASDQMPFRMASGGGFVIILKKHK